MPLFPRTIPWLVVLLPVTVCLVSGQERRTQWDPASFLQRLDRNENAILEPEEMVGRAKGFIEKLGVDASGPVAIENVMSAINRQRESSENERAAKAAAQANSSDWSSPRLVPGFGEAITIAPLPGFGAPNAQTKSPSGDKPAVETSDSVVTQVDRVLNQFDQNKDLVLDANEIQRTPWGPPSPQESDSNGDGRLTRDELIERYRKREADSSRFNGGTARSDAPRSQSTERRAPSGGAQASTNPTPTTNSSRSPTGRSASPDNRIADYVKNLLQQYDTDRDGSINADEQAKMKSTPKGADADSNGLLSRDELISYYGGGYRKPSTATDATEASGTTAVAKNSSEAPTRDRRRESRRRTSDSEGSVPMDGQKPIKMHEFTAEWTEEKLNEFRQMDVNRDGVISPEEFRQRK